MPAGMFSIDSILSGRPSCKEPLLLHRGGPLLLSGLADSVYGDYGGLYPAARGPSPPGVHSVSGTRIGYNGYYYGQLQVQGAGGAPPCCGAVGGLSPQQCPCIPAGLLRSRCSSSRICLRNSGFKKHLQKRHQEFYKLWFDAHAEPGARAYRDKSKQFAQKRADLRFM